MPGRTKAESAATAAAVLSAARELFTAGGYAGVGLERVAHEAGVTRGAVYHHFGSKERLFTAVLAQVHVEVGAAVVAAAQAAAAEGDGAWSGFCAGCRAFLSASTDPAVSRILLLDGPVVVGWAAWLDADANASGRHLGEGLEELAAAGLLADVPLAAAAAVLSGAMNEGALWVASQPAYRREAAMQQVWGVMELVLAGLRSPREPAGDE